MNSIHHPVSERILLHLLDYLSSVDEIEVPIQTTQEGIAQEICIQRKHVPRALKKLQELNLVIEKKGHILGKKQMLKTYFLTASGRTASLRIKHLVMDEQIYVVMNNQKSIRTVSETFHHFQKKYSYACIISMVSKKGCFDERDVHDEHENDTLSIDPFCAEEIYKKALIEAWKDGILTIDERNILRRLRESLHISERTHYRIQRAIIQSKKIDSQQIYRQVYDLVLTEVLKDKKISKDEEAILQRLKKHFHIDEEDY